MKKHLRRWAAIYVLVVLFVGSLVAQFFTQLVEFRNEAEAHGEAFAWSEYWPSFLASTFENWQSEWLQLIVQGAVLLGMKHLIFRADSEDIERLEVKVDALLDKAGIDVETIERWTDTTPPHYEMPGSLDPRRHGKS